MQLYGFSVGAVKRLILVEHGLYNVVACGNVLKAVDGVARGARIYCRRLARLPAIDCHAKDDLRTRRVVDLHPRFLARVGGEDQQQSSVQRLRAFLRRKSDGERLSRRECSREE